MIVPGAATLRQMLRDHVLAGLLRRRRFADAYARNYWRGNESRSGRGSSLTQTEAIRQALPDLCRTLGVQSLLDVPCGDFYWMRLVPLGCIDYVGADIVRELIAALQARESNPGRRFLHLDIVTHIPPHCDLVLCRDLLVHLPNRDIIRALHNIRRSDATWLLTTTFPGHANEDLRGRDWRPLNLQAPPFNFPVPLKLMNERCTEDNGRWSDKSLGLWRLADLL